MPLIFAAIVPHSPALLERVGKRHRRRLAATLASIRCLEQTLYAAQPETLVVVSPHGPLAADDFSCNLADRLQTSFSAFGDFSPSPAWRGDPVTAQQLRAANETGVLGPPLALRADAMVDYGVSVPLVHLTRHLPKLAVLPVSVSARSAAEHWQFGSFLGEQFRQSPRRIAVVASADLSHGISAKSPAGFTPRGAAFDRTILEIIRRGDFPALVSLPPDFVSSASACGFLPIVTLLGLLDGMNIQPEVLSYEGPLGVGLMTAQFTIG